MPTRKKLPTLAITLGDAAGIGPEVCLRALLESSSLACRPLLVGDPRVARQTLELLGCRGSIEEIGVSDLQAGELPRGRTLAVLAPQAIGGKALRLGAAVRPGRPSRLSARIAYASICTAVELAQAGWVDALCTAPISKEWFARAGVARTGHTEILAALTGARDVRMMMTVGDLRVVLATIHVPIRRVPRSLDVSGIARTIDMTAEHLNLWWRIRRPRIAVAALNPHAGDGGIYGTEEAEKILPALRRVRRRGVDASGPHPADTLFSALGPKADAFVAMYHDQGLVPIKQRDVHRAVNVTLGLPFVRTSPDHGTAYDLAGTGVAAATSMRAALELALELAPAHGRVARQRLS